MPRIRNERGRGCRKEQSSTEQSPATHTCRVSSSYGHGSVLNHQAYDHVLSCALSSNIWSLVAPNEQLTRHRGWQTNTYSAWISLTFDLMSCKGCFVVFSSSPRDKSCSIMYLFPKYRRCIFCAGFDKVTPPHQVDSSPGWG